MDSQLRLRFVLRKYRNVSWEGNTRQEGSIFLLWLSSGRDLIA